MSVLTIKHLSQHYSLSLSSRTDWTEWDIETKTGGEWEVGEKRKKERRQENWFIFLQHMKEEMERDQIIFGILRVRSSLCLYSTMQYTEILISICIVHVISSNIVCLYVKCISHKLFILLALNLACVLLTAWGSAEFGAIWTRDTFNINKMWINSQPALQLVGACPNRHSANQVEYVFFYVLGYITNAHLLIKSVPLAIKDKIPIISQC